MARGVTVWFTGLSGAGKTTVARRVEELLAERGYGVERLDGDVIRQSLTRDLGFSKEDRNKNIERVTFVAKLLTRQGVIVLCCFISPYRAMREACRRDIGSFLEVYVTAPMDALLERDVKGLYQQAIAGRIPNFTGVNDPYEEPESPDLVLETSAESVEASAHRVLALLSERGFLETAAAALPHSRRDAPDATGPVPKPFPGSILPHGGILVDRELAGRVLEDALRRSRELPQVPLDAKALADLEMIGTGAMSPLTGFMGQRDYLSVIEKMRLTDGLVWPMPITLSVSATLARSLREGSDITLTDDAGEAVALMHVTEIYPYDREVEAALVFGTRDLEHPGVAQLAAQGPYLLGGPVWVLRRPGQDQFPAHRLTPMDTRRHFDDKGWRRVVAFQTRNPVHRAHEYIQKSALEVVDGLLLHPLVGSTKSDDVPSAVRMQSYHAILGAYYPQGRVLLSVFPAAMRYAGPREAVFHALCRKNYGCTHFIVGRDHAGVGNYYGTYDAQKIFDQFRPEEIGIEPLRFEHTFYCRACGSMASPKTCPHDSSEHVVLSGSKVREMLRRGELPPAEFSRPEVARILADSMAASQ